MSKEAAMSNTVWRLAMLVTFALGCDGTLSGQGEEGLLGQWNFGTDTRGALVGPDGSKYPNPREVQRMTLELRGEGRSIEASRLCARSDKGNWCGRLLPYYTVMTTTQGEDCLQVKDVGGALISALCQPESAAPQPPPTTSESMPTAGCPSNGDPVLIGAQWFNEEFNEGLRLIGVDSSLAGPQAGAFDKPRSSEGEEDEEEEGQDLEARRSNAFESICESTLLNEEDPDQEVDEDILLEPCTMGSEDSDNEGGYDRSVLSCKLGRVVGFAIQRTCERVQSSCGGVDRHAVAEGIARQSEVAPELVCPGEEQLPEFAELNIECEGSPLIIDLAGNGLSLQGPDAGARFALYGGESMPTGWLGGSDDAMLAMDADGDGTITTGRELFGEASDGWAPDGFRALARHDENGDGRIDSSDPVFSRLLGWVDDGDAVAEPHELTPLSALGVTSIPVGARHYGLVDAYGNELGLVVDATLGDGRKRSVVDVWFRVAEPSAARRKIGD